MFAQFNQSNLSSLKPKFNSRLLAPFYLLLMLIVGALMPVHATENPLVGSWQLVSGKYLDGKGQWIDYADLKLSAIKVISAKHFSFTTVKNIGTAEEPVNEFWAAGTGSYQFSQSDYVEFPELNSFGVKPGTSFAFTYELKGNKWHTKRTEEGKVKEVEVWLKLD